MRQGLLELDTEISYLASDAVEEDPMNQPLGNSKHRVLLTPGKRGKGSKPSPTECHGVKTWSQRLILID